MNVYTDMIYTKFIIDHHFHYGEEMTAQRSTILSFGALTKYKPKTNVNVV